MRADEIKEAARRVSYSMIDGGADLDARPGDVLTAAAAFGLKDIMDGRASVVDDETASRLSRLLVAAGVSGDGDSGGVDAVIIGWRPGSMVLKLRFSRPVEIRCLKPKDDLIFQIMPGVPDGVDVPVDVMTVGLDDGLHVDDVYADAWDGNPGIAAAAGGRDADRSYARVELQDYGIFKGQTLGMFLGSLGVKSMRDGDGVEVKQDDLAGLDEIGG